MMIYFVNRYKREYVYVGEAEGESVSDVISSAGWNGVNDDIIIVSDVDNYISRGYRNVDSSSESESDGESESEVYTSDVIDEFMSNLRRRDSAETLTESTDSTY
jgi:hypothetical protein